MEVTAGAREGAKGDELCGVRVRETDSGGRGLLKRLKRVCFGGGVSDSLDVNPAPPLASCMISLRASVSPSIKWG